MKLESILWMQLDDASKNGSLVVNTKLVPNPDGNLYHMVNRKLLKVFPLSIFDESMVKKFINKSSNQYFQLGSGLFKGVAFRSCFLEKDENGKKEPFMYWKSSFQLSGFVNDATESASALKRTLDANELNFVEKYITRIRIRRIGFCLLALAIFVLLLMLTL